MGFKVGDAGDAFFPLGFTRPRRPQVEAVKVALLWTPTCDSNGGCTAAPLSRTLRTPPEKSFSVATLLPSTEGTSSRYTRGFSTGVRSVRDSSNCRHPCAVEPSLES